MSNCSWGGFPRIEGIQKIPLEIKVDHHLFALQGKQWLISVKFVTRAYRQMSLVRKDKLQKADFLITGGLLPDPKEKCLS